MPNIPCIEALNASLEAKKKELTDDLQTMLSSSGGDLGDMIATAAEELLARPATNILGRGLNQLFQGLDEVLAFNPIAEAAAQLMDHITAVEEVQLLLFGRLRDSLVEYLNKRIEMTQKVKRIAHNMLIAVSALPPRAEDEIIGQVRASEANLKNAIRLLEATLQQLQRNPPLYMHSFVVKAGNSVENAINALGGTTGTELIDELNPRLADGENPAFAGPDAFVDAITSYVSTQAEQYQVAFFGLRDGFKELADIIAFEDNTYSWFIPIIGVPLLGAKNNTIAGVSPKIQLMARQIQAFPFQVLTLGYMADAAIGAIRPTKESLEAIREEMVAALNEIARTPSGPFRVGDLYGKKIGWLFRLNTLSVALGNSRVNIFNEVGSDLSNLLEDVNSLYEIIDYLSQPDYIDNINNRVDQIVNLCIRMLPTAIEAFFNPTANAIFKNHLQDLNIHCNILLAQDNNLRGVLNRLDLTDNSNSSAAEFLQAVDKIFEDMGLGADILGLGSGALLTNITNLAVPGALSSLGAPFINLLNGDDSSWSNFADALPFSHTISGAISSWNDMMDCMEAHSVEVGVVQALLTPEISPQVAFQGIDESVNNAIFGVKMQLAASTPKVMDWSSVENISLFKENEEEETA